MQLTHVHITDWTRPLICLTTLLKRIYGYGRQLTTLKDNTKDIVKDCA
jgi:hypothetical protein